MSDKMRRYTPGQVGRAGLQAWCAHADVSKLEARVAALEAELQGARNRLDATDNRIRALEGLNGMINPTEYIDLSFPKDEKGFERIRAVGSNGDPIVGKWLVGHGVEWVYRISVADQSGEVKSDES